MQWHAKLALGLLFANLVSGQLIRWPLPGQGGGILPSDVAAVLVLLVAVFELIKHKLQNTKHKQSRNHKTEISNQVFNFGFGSCLCLVLFVLCFFTLWSLFTLAIRLPELGTSPGLIAFSYWARLTAHLFLIPALILLFQNQNLRRFASRALSFTIAALVILGFLQLLLVPNLGALPAEALAKAGWDPHQGRLVSTWLDPNFFGGFLILILPWMFAKAFLPLEFTRRIGGKGEWTPKAAEGVVVVMAVAALLFTQSRTSLIALAGSALLLSPLILFRFLPLEFTRRIGGEGEYSPKAREGVVVALVSSLVLCLLLGALGFLALGDRALGLFTLDATAQLRLNALKEVWHLAEEHSLLGVGVGAYQFAARETGLIGDFAIHSRAGADNSWLTLWITTGLPGVVLFALIWSTIARQLLARRSLGEGWAALLSLLALFIHSQFINSFLYSHILITLAVIIALSWRSTPSSSS